MPDTEQTQEHFDLLEIFAAERPRLVRLCARLSGNSDAAEDLAQEVLLIAWQRAGQLHEPQQYAPWLSAIARNVCLNWSRRHYREQAQLAQQEPDGAGNLIDTISDDFDLEVELERQELATLLDQALALLPDQTRQALVEHYIQESPHAEIAAKLGVSEGAVALRLHRGKLALRRVLTSNLSEELATYRTVADDDRWEDTRIWCPTCARTRLQGWFQRDGSPGRFMLRCPACDTHPNAFTAGADLSIPFYADVIGDVKAFKPAFSRFITAVGNQYRQALASGHTTCVMCGRDTAMLVGPSSRMSPGDPERHEMRLQCTSCGWTSNNSLWSLTMILPEAQRLWRDHPRLRCLPAREIEVGGVEALVQSTQSVTGSARLDVVVLRHNFEVVQVHTTSGT
jgi:RNA polymerase sigma factor (sigma-70 family)